MLGANPDVKRRNFLIGPHNDTLKTIKVVKQNENVVLGSHGPAHYLYSTEELE